MKVLEKADILMPNFAQLLRTFHDFPKTTTKYHNFAVIDALSFRFSELWSTVKMSTVKMSKVKCRKNEKVKMSKVKMSTVKMSKQNVEN